MQRLKNTLTFSSQILVILYDDLDLNDVFKANLNIENYFFILNQKLFCFIFFLHLLTIYHTYHNKDY